jgi:hypothetical protein
VDELGVEEGFGIASDIINQGLNQILRLPAACADEYPVPGMYAAEDFILSHKLLWIRLPKVFQVSFVLHLFLLGTEPQNPSCIYNGLVAAIDKIGAA